MHLASLIIVHAFMDCFASTKHNKTMGINVAPIRFQEWTSEFLRCPCSLNFINSDYVLWVSIQGFQDPLWSMPQKPFRKLPQDQSRSRRLNFVYQSVLKPLLMISRPELKETSRPVTETSPRPFWRHPCKLNLFSSDDVLFLKPDLKPAAISLLKTSPTTVLDTYLQDGTMSFFARHKFRDHFAYAPNQWETTLHCNVVSHWLGAYTTWSLQNNDYEQNIYF